MKGGSSELLLDPQAELRKQKLLNLTAATAKKPKPQQRTCRQKFWFYATSFFTMSAVSAGSSLLFLVPLYVDPAISTLVADFTPHPVTCTTTRREELSGIFNCSWSSCREGCTSDMYRCTHIYVNYTPYGNDTLEDDFEGILLVNIKGCGYPPDVTCSNFTDMYGEPGSEFPCYYSRQNRTVVMRHYNRDRQVEVIIHYFAIPFVVTVVTSVVLCVMHCDCRRSQAPVIRRTRIHDQRSTELKTQPICNPYLLPDNSRMVALFEVIVNRPKRLVMPFWTPFHIPDTPEANAAMFAFFQTTMIIKTISNFPVDTLFLHLSNQICERLYILKNTMEIIGTSGEYRENLFKIKILNVDKNIDDEQLLKICLKEHVTILKLIKRLSKILDEYFVPLTFNSFTSLIFAFFLVSQSENMVREVFKIATWTMIMFGQIYVACWAGELIKKRCGDIHFAAFNNAWYDTEPKVKKSLAIVQTYTAQPVVLRGAFIFELSLHTYETVIREVFSSFTILLQLYQN